jgi:hypothetical protein
MSRIVVVVFIYHRRKPVDKLKKYFLFVFRIRIETPQKYLSLN